MTKAKSKSQRKNGLKYTLARLLPDELEAARKYAGDTNRSLPNALQEIVKESLRIKGYLPKQTPEVMIEEA